ncbi:MAG: hypothetical protein WC614_07240 [bacterium]
MVLIILYFINTSYSNYSYSGNLNIRFFEASQRLKGLSPDFANLIHDTITDLIYTPGSASFLSQSLLFVDFSADSSPVYSIGYFSPSLIRKISGGVYFESGIKNFQDPVLYNEASFKGWIRSIFSLGYAFNEGKMAISAGGDITKGTDRDITYAPFGIYLPYTSTYTYDNKKFFANIIKNSGRFPAKINIEYQSCKIDSICYDYGWYFHNYYYVDSSRHGDTLSYTYEDWYSHYENIKDEKEEHWSTWGITLLSSLRPSPNRKTNLFISIKAGTEGKSFAYRYFNQDSSDIKRTWILEDSTVIKDTVLEVDQTSGGLDGLYYPDRQLAIISAGIGQENRLNDKTSVFVGLKLSINTSEDDEWERLFLPLGMEYKVFKELIVRAGVTMYAKRKYSDFERWNSYYFGIGFSPANKLNIDLSNRGNLTNLSDWQFGLIKRF